MLGGEGTQWSNDFQALKRGLISRRSTGIPLSVSEVQSNTKGLDNLQAKLRGMVTSPSDYGLAPSEIARREVLLDSLRSLVVKGALVTGSSSSSFASSAGGSLNSASLSKYNPDEISTKGLSVQREAVLKEQDNILSQIGSGVDRLFMQAVTIGEETSMHSRLLDTLDDNVDVTQRALKEEAKHAEVIRNKSRFFYMYLCIGLEIVIIVLLLVLWAMK